MELAKVNADKPEDDEALTKKLWLMIARHVIQDKNDIKKYAHDDGDDDTLQCVV